MRAARPKLLEIFGRAALGFGAVFLVIYLSLTLCAAARHRFGMEIQNLLEFIDWPYLFMEIVGFPRIAAQIARER